jgi:thymidylate synthase ThyX
VETFIVDDQKPEVVAMLQALYSRSPKSVVTHLEQVRKRGPDNFMSTYYVGYGHKSIGDCGTTSIFIENVSMLAAKAVQDTPLYNGQEASTRYLDMKAQQVLNPLGTEEGEEVQRAWMALYSDSLDLLIKDIKQKYPKKPEEKETIWEKAVAAKAFDIARGLLPAGITTYVAWHVNLRQANDHLKEMRNHPLQEIKDMAAQIQEGLNKVYPSSFAHKIYPDEEKYIAESMARFAFYYEPIERFTYKSTLDLDALENKMALLSSRPKKSELHQRFRQYGTVQFKFPLDFGSYRDLQRQRSAVQEMPLLTTELGFHDWYIENLPESIVERIQGCKEKVEALNVDKLIKQYYIPMGYLVPVVLTCTLPSAVYIAELRSSTTVHPTLRTVAQRFGTTLKELLPTMALHIDDAPDAWSLKRGTQDICKKNSLES